MNERGSHISRPLYEALPWIYMAAGVVALVLSYFIPTGPTGLLWIPGLAGVLGGIVIALRRRDFRQMKANNYLGDSGVGGGSSDEK